MTSPTLNMALTTYGFPHLIGSLATKDGTKHPNPMTVRDILKGAKEFGLAGVDMGLPPVSTMPTEELRDLLAEYDLRIVSEYMVIVDPDMDAIRDYLQRSAAV